MTTRTMTTRTHSDMHYDEDTRDGEYDARGD